MSQYQKLKGTSETTFSIGLGSDKVELTPDITNSHVDVTCINGPMTIGVAHPVVWGDIGGTLSNQADLQTALDGKSDINHNHDGVYSPIDHNHAGVYEPANANIQSHIAQITGNPHHVTAAEAGAAPAIHSHDYVWDITAGLNITIDKTDPRNPIISSAGGSGVWGSITGILSDQTDLQNELDGKAPVVHTHDESDITNLDKYTQAEVDALLAGKSDTTHNHAGVYEPANANIQAHISTTSGNPHNVLFAELSDAPATYPPSAHTHVEGDITNLDKYTQAEVDANFAPIVHNHDGVYEPANSNIQAHIAQVSGQDPHGTMAPHLAVLNPHGKMNWRGKWTSATYELHDVAEEDGWLMIANKQTTDHAAPQATGAKAWIMPEAPAWNLTLETPALIHSGIEFTVTQSGWYEGLRVWVPKVSESTNYRFVLVNLTDPDDPKFTIFEEPVLTPNAWTTISLTDSIVPVGSVFRIYIDALDSGAGTTVTGGWTRAANNNTGTVDPGVGAWGTNNAGTLLRLNKTDADAVDRGTELLGIVAGSDIQFVSTVEPTRSVTYLVTAAPTDNTAHVTYAVTQSAEGVGGLPDIGVICTMTADVPVPQDTQAVEFTDYWLTPENQPPWATVTGYLTYDGVPQVGMEENAYGIDILFTPGELSPDWDYMNHVGSGGGGGGGTPSEGVPEAPTDGTLYGRKDALWASIQTADVVGLDTALAGKAPTVHTHTESDITNLDKYTQAEADALFAPMVHNHDGVYEPANANIQSHITTITGNPHQVTYGELTGVPSTFPPSAHTHLEADVTDLDKYTVAEVDSLLAGKAPTVHTHVETDITNLDKYTQAEVDGLIAAIPPYLTWSSAQPATAIAGQGYRVDTTVNATIALPATPVDDEVVGFNDRLGGFETTPLTIGRNGRTIMGVAEDMTVSVNWTTVVLQYDAGDDNWWVVYKT